MRLDKPRIAPLSDDQLTPEQSTILQPMDKTLDPGLDGRTVRGRR